MPMSKHLKDWRKKRNLKQAAAAEMAGVTQPSWAKWESGKVPPEQCLMVHRLTAIPLHVLRPDIYPAPKRKAGAA